MHLGNRAWPGTRRSDPQGIRRVAGSLRPTSSSQAAGGAFIERLAQRTEDLDTPSGPDVVGAQMARSVSGSDRREPASAISRASPAYARRQRIHDEMIPVSNSYRLAETFQMPHCSRTRTLDTGPFPVHDSFTRQAAAFLASDAPFAAY